RHVRLGSARGEHDVARRGSNECGHLFPRLLDQMACGAALAMDRGRVTDEVERGKRRRARLFAQWRGCVPIEVDALVHGLRSAAVRWRRQASGASTRCETLAFCPRTRARKRPPRAPVGVGDSRLRKSEMVLDT